MQCNLTEEADLEEAAATIVSYAAVHDGPWVRGGGWRFEWFEHGEPGAAALDVLVPDRPAYLTVADGHAGWANSRALALAGIDATTPDPPDGRIQRLTNGDPQGTLHEGAMALVERVLPAESGAEMEAALLAGQQYLLKRGITAWQDAMVTPELHGIYNQLAGDGRLKARVRGALWWPRDTGPDQFEMLEARRREATGRYKAGSVKLMLDGVCENFTALMLEPYLDATGRPTDNHGIEMLDPSTVPGVVSELMGRGFQPHLHAIGDGAVRLALDAVERGRLDHGAADVRPHIAHLQVIDPDDLPRFRRLGVTANVQPLWACADEAMTRLTTPFLGAVRSARQYPFGSLLRHGAVLALGSDWPVSTPEVMAQLAVAATRQPPGEPGVAPFLPDERIGLVDGLMAATAGSSYVNHHDDSSGRIEVGLDADLVVLSANPFETSDMSAVSVDTTVVRGEAVYESSGAA